MLQAFTDYMSEKGHMHACVSQEDMTKSLQIQADNNNCYTTHPHTHTHTYTHTHTHIKEEHWHAQSTEVFKKLLAEVARLMVDVLKALCNTTLIAPATGYTHTHTSIFSFLICNVWFLCLLHFLSLLLLHLSACSVAAGLKCSFLLIKPVKNTPTVIVLCEQLSEN